MLCIQSVFHTEVWEVHVRVLANAKINPLVIEVRRR